MTRPAWWWQGLVIGALMLGGLIQHLHPRVLANAIHDPDAGWHLSVGRLIVETGGVPDRDPLCFTSVGSPWVNLNWLADAMLYVAFLVGGFAGALALASAVTLWALGAYAVALRRRGANAVWGWLALLPLVVLLIETHGLRPRIWTFALLATVLALFADGQRLGAGRCVALVGLLWLWDQLHGGFAFGYVLLGCVALGDAVQAWRQGEPLPARVKELVGVLALGAVGWLLHPQGLASVEHVLLYPQRVGTAALTRIRDAQPLGLDDPLGWLLIPVVVLAAAAARGKQARGGELVASLAFVLLAFKSRRVVTAALLVTLPWVAAWLSASLPLPALERRLRAGFHALPLALLLTLAVWLGWFVPGRLAPRGVPGDVSHPAWSQVAFPRGAAAHLLAEGGEGRVLNLYSAGGLLGWGLYPQRRLLIDGRTDLHRTTYADYTRVVDLAPGWERIVADWDVELALLPAGAPLTAALRAAGWSARYDDGAWVVLARA